MNRIKPHWWVLSVPVQMGLSEALWWPGSGRTFPITPVFDAFSILPHSIHWALSGLFFLCCVVYATGRIPSRVFLPVAISLAALLCALDVNRLQVWLWLWVGLWAVEWVDLRRSSASGYGLWVLAAVYCWSGLFKMTPWFATNFDWFCQALPFTKPFAGNAVAAYGAATFEALIGLALLWPATRTVGKWAATVLHLYIMVVLRALDWNAVVLPWNLAMIGLVWHYADHKAPMQWVKHPVLVAIWVAVWVMPVLNKWNYWPESLSWKMYSNTHREASIVTTGEQGCPSLEAWPKEQKYMTVDDWGFRELRVPPFNSMANFQRALQKAQQSCSDSLYLDVLTVDWWNKEVK